ncbi:MAG: ABC transporter permease, partial [Deltaproteobacteria bacterium]|nr:ABC transporter permease [Deltaproteobacteria bacterium]
MFDLDKWQEIAQTLGKNKLRTVLTALGVFWGIFMLVIMLGFGSSLEGGVKKNMMGFSTNAVYIWGRETKIPFQGLKPGRRISFRNADIQALRERVPEIEHLAPRGQLGGFRNGVPVAYGDKTAAFNIMGDYPEFAYVQPMTFTAGRFINDIDMREKRKVAVIGSEVVKQIFDSGESPVGRYIKIRGVYFQVVGSFSVLSSGHMGDRLANTIYIPFATFQQAFNWGDRIGWFAITAREGASAAAVEDKTRTVLADIHRVDPGDRNAIGSWNTGKEFNKIQSLFSGVRMTIWIVGIFTLLAGVIGVSNIMLIAVKERTKEIGIRKALGATPRAIVSMVLQEALLLTSMAGYLGLVAGVGVLEIAASLIGDGVGEGGRGRRGG